MIPAAMRSPAVVVGDDDGDEEGPGVGPGSSNRRRGEQLGRRKAYAEAGAAMSGRHLDDAAVGVVEVNEPGSDPPESVDRILVVQPARSALLDDLELKGRSLGCVEGEVLLSLPLDALRGIGGEWQHS